MSYHKQKKRKNVWGGSGKISKLNNNFLLQFSLLLQPIMILIIFSCNLKIFYTVWGVTPEQSTIRLYSVEVWIVNNFQSFMLGWPCSMNFMNNNQLNALFIFSLLSYHTSKCFGRNSSPSSGGRMYICGKWYLLYYWTDCQQARPGPLTANCKICHIYTFYFLMMSCWYARNM
jgi:hypothetical protein